MKPNFLVAIICLATAYPLFAHARWLTGPNIVLRNNNAGNKENSAPCGPGLRNLTPATLQAGDVITVEWEETVEHPGYYQINFSLGNDAGFRTIKTVQDDQDDPNTVPHSYSTTITVPNSNCDGCTLQLIQFMTENSPPTKYFSCADIQIVGGEDVPLPSPAATPFPTYSPAESDEPDCHEDK